MSVAIPRPLRDNIVVQVLAREETTESGIVLVDNARQKPVEAKVLAVGEGLINADGSTHQVFPRVGDCVLFSKFAQNFVTIGDQEFLILSEDEVTAVLRN